MTTNATRTVGGVILGAGRSSRFEGGNKLLAPVEGTPVIRRVGQLACTSALADVVAVLGHEAGAVGNALEGLPLTTRHTDAYDSGQSRTLRVGVTHAIEADWDGVVVLLGDMPFIEPATVDALVHAFRAGDGSIIVPRFEGQRGNPVLFAAHHFTTLTAVTGDRGGRALVRAHPDTAFVDVADQGVRRDIDTVADLDRYVDT